MKTCSTCRLEKPLSDFYKSKARGAQTYCKICANARRAQWARDNLAKVKTYRLKYRYGLTDTDVERMLVEQNNCCELCGEEFDEESILHIDHDHNCCSGISTCGDCVRGILHSSCNTILGWFETTHKTDKFLKYLEKYSPPKH